MSDDRPDPDALLARVAADEKPARGKLKIFFGAAPGVGKTYAMLEAGRKSAKEGADVLVGYIEPHVRPETQALVLGLDMLARREVAYRGTTLVEFDLEAALAARPQLILVDELAHTNAPGLTHAKRWQDVEKLCDAGMDVYTTLNVQHLESLNDAVAQITGVVVRETVPDSIFERADEVELVDLAPDDLIDRLRSGKVYVAEQGGRAIENFFNRGNLIALRELALRSTAERVNEQVRSYRASHAVGRTWPTSDRLLVAVGPSPHSARLVRATRRLASQLRAPWLAVHVETPGSLGDKQDRDRVAQSLHLAEQLGAQTGTTAGYDPVDALLSYAAEHNVSKIVVGKPQRSRWQELWRRSLVDELARRSGDIDIYVISGEGETTRPRRRSPGQKPSGWAYLAGVAAVTISTVVGHFMQPHFALANIIMVYLLGVVGVSIRFGHGPSITATVLSVAAFDFFFVPPELTFAVSDTQYLVTFAVMLVTGLVTSTLTARVRQQADAARWREQRTGALYAMSKELVQATGDAELARLAARHIGDVFDSDVFLLLPTADKHGAEGLAALGITGAALTDHDLGVAQWVFRNGERAGRGTDTLPSAASLFLPLRTQDVTLGILAVRPRQPALDGLHLASEQVRLLETFAGQLALALERVEAVVKAQQARLEAESERLRNSLLSAVSHDLRTPLSAIAGASSTLVDENDMLDERTRRELAESIFAEADRLNQLVGNLLDMTRLESGALFLHRDWQVFEEIVGVVLGRMKRLLAQHKIVVRLSPDLPLVPCDSLLIEQVLTNLLENAAKYSPAGTPIELSARVAGKSLEVQVADRGPGLAHGDEERIFKKFYRAASARSRSGVGLGLSICRGIVELHGGKIWAANRPDGGTSVHFTLPLGEQPPSVRLESVASDVLPR